MTALAQLMCLVHHRGKLSLSMKYIDTSGTMELEGDISYITSPEAIYALWVRDSPKDRLLPHLDEGPKR